jgi:putative PIN family toxin of toxin-antitoxin system
VIPAVLDANVLASGAVSVAGPVADLIDAWRSGDIDVVVSDHIVSELERTLRESYFARRLPSPIRDAFVALVREEATLVPITTPVPAAAPDRADNLVLATAESARVAYLVTGDGELQRLARHRDIAILPPRAFADLLGLG